MLSLRPHRHLLASAVLLGLAGGDFGQGQASPFAPGLRWSARPDPGAPWIPRDVTFAAEGSLVLAAPAVGTPRLELFAATGPLDPAPRLFSHALDPATLGAVQVAAGDGPGELFALYQVPDPTPSLRRTWVERFDAPAAIGGAGFVPAWSHDLGVLVNNTALLCASRDGTRAAAAVPVAPGGPIQLDLLAGQSGSLERRWTLAGNAARALCLTADGSRVALAAGTKIWVLDPGGAVLFERDTPTNTNALALSEDGAWLAFGTDVGVELWHADPGGPFAFERLLDTRAGEVVVELAFGAAGSRLAASWWDASGTDDCRLSVHDVASGVPLHGYLQSGEARTQNFPSALGFSHDGRRVALGLWGTSDARPEALLFEVGDPLPRLALDLPGSVEAMDLDPLGQGLALATKDAHANQFSRTGAVHFATSGEADLLLLEAPRPGGSFVLLFADPGPGLGFFLGGTPSRNPLTASLFSGELWLRVDQPVHLFSAQREPGGNLRAVLPLPPDPALLGVPLGVQALGLYQGTLKLSRTRLAAFVL